MAIFAVIFANFFYVKKLAINIFFQNLHLLSFPTTYSLPCFPLKFARIRIFSPRTPAKVRSNLKRLNNGVPWGRESFKLMECWIKHCLIPKQQDVPQLSSQSLEEKESQEIKTRPIEDRHRHGTTQPCP